MPEEFLGHDSYLINLYGIYYGTANEFARDKIEMNQLGRVDRRRRGVVTRYNKIS